MSFNFVKTLQNFWHTIVTETQKDVIEYGAPAAHVIVENGGKALLAIAEAARTSAAAGTPWAVLKKTVENSAREAGKELAKDAAEIALNSAKASLLAQGKPTV